MTDIRNHLNGNNNVHNSQEFCFVFSTQKPTRPASLNYKNKEWERQSEKREKDGVIGTEIKHILGQC